jgi:ABC-type transport system involved in multi-copper enzyme maturation permease subunit
MIVLKFLYTRLQSRILTWLFWVLVWLALGLVFANLFDSLSQEAQETEKLITNLPAALRGTFNIDTGYLTQVEKFLSGQFLTVYTLIGTIFALIQGVYEIGGKVEDRTISNYLTKNISRTELYLSQFFANLVFFVTSSGVVWGLVYGFFRIFSDQSEISIEYFLATFLMTSALFVTTAGAGQLLGILFPKNIAQLGGIGVLVFSWFLNSLSSIGGFPEWLKPFSPFYYLNVLKLRDEFAVDWSRFGVLMSVYVACLVVGILVFRKKDLYL